MKQMLRSRAEEGYGSAGTVLKEVSMSNHSSHGVSGRAPIAGLDWSFPVRQVAS